LSHKIQPADLKASIFTTRTYTQLMVGMASARYPADLVLTALAMTVAVTAGLGAYALRTKTDWTAKGGFL
jgi:FtsH-binding integral membrane protein